MKKGQHHTMEFRERMSKIAKDLGYGKWLKGRKQSKEIIEKRIPKIIKALTGKKLSEEHKKKIIKSRIGKWVGEQNPRWNNGISKNRQEYSRNYKRTEKSKIKAKLYREKNREKYRIYAVNRRFLKFGALGSHNIGEWEYLKKQYGYTCPSCKKTEPNIKLTEDHIIPLIKGGSNFIENIQPLCQSCNSIKHTKIIKYGI